MNTFGFDLSLLIMLDGNRIQRTCKVLPVIIVCTIVSFCMMLLAQGGFGIKYIRDCLNQPVIPICMIVVGGSLLLFCCCGGDICNYVINFFLFFISCIAGNACIIAIYKPKFSLYAEEEYCNETLYWFAFGSTIFTYFLLLMVCWGLAVSLIGGLSVMSVRFISALANMSLYRNVKLEGLRGLLPCVSTINTWL